MSCRAWSVAALLSASLLFSCAASAQGDRVIAIKAARLIDGTGRAAIEDAVLLIRGERILAVGSAGQTKIPAEAEIIDRGDETLLPGLIDAHAHLSIRPDTRTLEGQLEGMRQPDGTQMLRAVRNVRLQLLSGVTTLYVVGEMHFNDVYLAEAIGKGIVPGPRIVPGGEFITTTAGHGPEEYRATDGPWELRKKVRRQAENGAEHIKLTVTDRLRAGPRTGAMFASGESNFSKEEMKVVVEEAHRLGLSVTAHANNESIRLAVEAGVDSIQHGYGLTDELNALLVKHGKGVVHTYTIGYQAWFNEWDYADNEAQDAADWLQHVRAMHARVLRQQKGRADQVKQRRAEVLNAHRAGVTIAVGTDSMHGLLPLEVENLVAAGLTPLEAITAATSIAARVVGVQHTGRLEAGMLADVISVRGDPSKRIEDLGNVTFVMVGGRRYDSLSFR